MPMADLRDGSLRGVETAVRWHHPERGLIAATEFEQMVADSGMAQQVDEWVITRAATTFAAWKEDGLPVADIDLVGIDAAETAEGVAGVCVGPPVRGCELGIAPLHFDALAPRVP